MIVYVGTYTKMGGPGIAICSLLNGKLKLLDSVQTVDPGYLTLSSDQTKMYAVSKDAADRGIAGSCLIFDRDGYKLHCVGQYGTGAEGPSHLCLSPDQRFLYTANYASGSISVIPVDPAGERIQLICHHGRGLHPTRQMSAHVHHVSFIPKTNLLIAVDLGIDALSLYHQDTKTGLLTALDTFFLPAGWGPRHIAYGTNGLIYLVHELKNAVSVLSFDGSTFSICQTVTTLPETWSVENTAAAIRTTRESVWVSNRGHDSLARFHILKDGQLKPAGFFPTGGSIPRDFVWTDASTAVVANQGGSITLLTWDQRSEMLSLKDSIELAGPICVCPAYQI